MKSLKFSRLQYATVNDYCLGYVWMDAPENIFTLSLDVCLCFNDNLLKASETKAFPNKLYHR